MVAHRDGDHGTYLESRDLKYSSKVLKLLAITNGNRRSVEILVFVENSGEHDGGTLYNGPPIFYEEPPGPNVTLSDFVLYKPLEKYFSMLLEVDDFVAQDSKNEGHGQSGTKTAPWLMAKERLQQWKHNHCALAYSTVGTFYYLAPKVLLKKGYKMECDCTRCS
ncbi:protein kinase family protein [Striga asiatica]|uniref:Protein kinase family protein n=1 Tax=Striga asiatica TaxID=4170 RepID=A0A5A7PY34_STRAF|nr:protein kinase family protein [Striga asiatica]